MDNARARDSISGRQGSLTPAAALAPARPRRLYYDVYGLIRDILEMSRVHARRVAGKCGKAGEVTGPGGPGGGEVLARSVETRRGGTRNGGCKDRRAVAHAERVSHCRYVRFPPSPFILSQRDPLPPPPSSSLSSTTHSDLSFAVLSTGSVLRARPLAPLVSRRYGRSRLVATIGSVRAV